MDAQEAGNGSVSATLVGGVAMFELYLIFVEHFVNWLVMNNNNNNSEVEIEIDRDQIRSDQISLGY